MIKAVTFDLDGVYFPDGKAKFIEALQAYGINQDNARRVFLESPEMNQQYKLGKMSDEQYWSWAAKEWGLEIDPAVIIKLLIDCYSIDEQVKQLVKTVRRQGYKTLICSNNFPARVNGLQEKFGFSDDFDAAIFSYEVGAAKPDKAIFQALIDASGVKGDEIVYSDDNIHKLTGALELSITAFVYEGFDKFVNQLVWLGVDVS